MLFRSRLSLNLAVIVALCFPLPLKAADTPPLKQRVKRLEATVRTLRERIRRLEEELERMKSKPPGRADTPTPTRVTDGETGVRADDHDGHDTSIDVPDGSARFTRDRFRRVQPSMAPAAVRNLLGTPDRIERGDYPSLMAALRGRGRVVRWFYRRRAGGSTVRARIVFRNRRVQDKTWRSDAEPAD